MIMQDLSFILKKAKKSEDANRYVRMTFSFLYPEDHQIIKFLQSIPKSRRSLIVREALTNYIQCLYQRQHHSEVASSENIGTDDIKSALSSLIF